MDLSGKKQKSRGLFSSRASSAATAEADGGQPHTPEIWSRSAAGSPPGSSELREIKQEIEAELEDAGATLEESSVSIHTVQTPPAIEEGGMGETGAEEPPADHEPEAPEEPSAPEEVEEPPDSVEHPPTPYPPVESPESPGDDATAEPEEPPIPEEPAPAELQTEEPSEENPDEGGTDETTNGPEEEDTDQTNEQEQDALSADKLSIKSEEQRMLIEAA